MNVRILLLFLAGFLATRSDAEPAFVRVSPRDAHYLELSDGQPYIPIGLNLIHPNTRDEDGLKRMGEWMEKLSTNGGNYIRVWLSSYFWDVESAKAGEYEPAKAQRIDTLLDLARRHGIRVKLTLEHFRTLEGEPRQRWAHKPILHVSQGGPATNLADFFAGAASREQFKRKLNWFAQRYGSRPEIYGWELWNEVNAVACGANYYLPWTETMLHELHERFPNNLAMQSLGSFDHTGTRELYRKHSLLPGNEVAQVHRYLDLGANWEICHGPVDVLAAEAVRELATYNPGRPIILAESGAVEPRHSGPFKLYAQDKAGMLLHDVLFAPFFAGAAGGGQIWHWDVYVDRNNLWWHFGRFAEAVKGIDPAAERFKPFEIPHPALRIYGLKGAQTTLLWCRDKANTWERELRDGEPPKTLSGLELKWADLSAKAKIACYNPWQNQWQTLKEAPTGLRLPPFQRSLVVQIR